MTVLKTPKEIETAINEKRFTDAISGYSYMMGQNDAALMMLETARGSVDEAEIERQVEQINKNNDTIEFALLILGVLIEGKKED